MEAGIATASNQRSWLISDLWRRLLLSAFINRIKIIKKAAEPNASTYRPDVEPSHAAAVLDPPPPDPHLAAGSTPRGAVGGAPVVGSGGDGEASRWIRLLAADPLPPLLV
jgi:hypothetical protein